MVILDVQIDLVGSILTLSSLRGTIDETKGIHFRQRPVPSQNDAAGAARNRSVCPAVHFCKGSPVGGVLATAMTNSSSLATQAGLDQIEGTDTSF